MRAILSVLTLVVLGLVQTACTTTPGKPSDAYADRRGAEFVEWSRRERNGTIPDVQIQDCALCPALMARKSGMIWWGSPTWDRDRQPNEFPPTEVAIPNGYAIGIHEVTRGEFKAFVVATHRAMKGGCRTDRREPGQWNTDAHASFLEPGFPQDDDHPAVCVSLIDARDYVAWLNTRTDGGYRLPTEAEWHFAGMGGQYSTYVWGEEPESACRYANLLDASATSGHPRNGAAVCNDGFAGTSPVGRYAPTALLTYDMAGNAAEWTETCSLPADDGFACPQAIVKGGSWKSTPVELRFAARTAVPIDTRDNSIGFRVAKSLGDPDALLTTADAYLQRGRRALWQLDFRRALADLERAVELEPRDSHALAARGWAHFRLGEHDLARNDFTDAVALDSSNADAVAGLGLVALVRRDPREALRQLDLAVSLEPDFVVALSSRATVHMILGQTEAALDDSAHAIRLSPTDIDMLRMRVRIRAARTEWPQMLDEIDQLLHALPRLEAVQAFAAEAYSAVLHDAEAFQAANVALGAYRSAGYFLLRAAVRPWSDVDGRRFDIDAALELEPTNPEALRALGELESHVGHHDAAVRALTNLLSRDAKGSVRSDAFSRRAVEYFALGDRAAAQSDLDSSLGKNPEPVDLNDLCWRLAVGNVALDRALAYCDRALAAEPRTPNYLDSRGAVFLRMKRWNEAIEAYDAAIRLKPDLASSYYGRGIAWQSRCNCAEGTADLLRALKTLPSVQRDYEHMGLLPPYPPDVVPVERASTSPR